MIMIRKYMIQKKTRQILRKWMIFCKNSTNYRKSKTKKKWNILELLPVKKPMMLSWWLR